MNTDNPTFGADGELARDSQWRERVFEAAIHWARGMGQFAHPHNDQDVDLRGASALRADI